MSIADLPKVYISHVRTAQVYEVDRNPYFVQAYKKYVLGLDPKATSVDEIKEELRFSLLLLRENGKPYSDGRAILGLRKVRLNLSKVYEMYAFNRRVMPANIDNRTEALVELYSEEPNICEQTFTVRHLQSLVRPYWRKDAKKSMVLHPLEFARYDPSELLDNVIKDLAATYGRGAETLPLRIFIISDGQESEITTPPTYKLGVPEMAADSASGISKCVSALITLKDAYGAHVNFSDPRTITGDSGIGSVQGAREYLKTGDIQKRQIHARGLAT